MVGFFLSGKYGSLLRYGLSEVILSLWRYSRYFILYRMFRASVAVLQEKGCLRAGRLYGARGLFCDGGTFVFRLHRAEFFAADDGELFFPGGRCYRRQNIRRLKLFRKNAMLK